jgi:hypothetical protein
MNLEMKRGPDSKVTLPVCLLALHFAIPHHGIQCSLLTLQAYTQTETEVELTMDVDVALAWS